MMRLKEKVKNILRINLWYKNRAIHYYCKTIADFRTLLKAEVETAEERLFAYLPTLPKRLCLVFSNLCNILMLIAVQSSAPFSSKRG